MLLILFTKMVCGLLELNQQLNASCDEFWQSSHFKKHFEISLLSSSLVL